MREITSTVQDNWQDYVLHKELLDVLCRACVRNLKLRVLLSVLQKRARGCQVVVRTSKSAGARCDVLKFCGNQEPLAPVLTQACTSPAMCVMPSDVHMQWQINHQDSFKNINSLTTVAMHLRAEALVETQHFFSKGHSTKAQIFCRIQNGKCGS